MKYNEIQKDKSLIILKTLIQNNKTKTNKTNLEN